MDFLLDSDVQRGNANATYSPEYIPPLIATTMYWRPTFC
jgi:hypothetical protein